MKRSTVLLVCGTLSILAPRIHASEPAGDAVAAAVERRDYSSAAALLRARLRDEPGDEASRFTLARVLAWSGDYSAAVTEYDRLIALDPADVDYSFGRAQALAWAGRDRDALADLDRARSLAPDYEDVWRLELAVLARQDDSAQRLHAFRQEAARRFPQSAWWKESEHESADASTELSFGGTWETLSTDVPDWTRFFAQVTRHRNEGPAVYGTISREARFGRSDSVIGGGGDWPLTKRWLVGFDLDLGPDADFLPRVEAAARAMRTLPAGWQTQLRLRRRNYRNAAVTSAALTVDRYFGNFRAAYTVDLSRLQGDAASAGHIATLDYYASARLQLDVTVADGREAEAIGPDQIRRTDVRGFTLEVRRRLNDRWRLSGWLGSHRQGDFYTRRYVGLSLATEL